jgi:DNA mismatch repair protein MutS2
VLSTGEAGQVRSEARAAVEEIARRLVDADERTGGPRPTLVPAAGTLEPGARVTVGRLGLEGTLLEVRGDHADVDVRGKRMRAAARDLRVIAPPPAATQAPRKAQVKVNVDLQPRQGSLSEINVVGCTVDEALTRVEKFLDASTLTDQTEMRIVHGFGTGRLRRAIAGYLKAHPLVASYKEAEGATIVNMKD